MTNNFVRQGNLSDDAIFDNVAKKIHFESVITGTGSPVTPPSLTAKRWLYVDRSLTPAILWLWDPSVATWVQVAEGAGTAHTHPATAVTTDPEVTGLDPASTNVEAALTELAARPSGGGGGNPTISHSALWVHPAVTWSYQVGQAITPSLNWWVYYEFSEDIGPVDRMSNVIGTAAAGALLSTARYNIGAGNLPGALAVDYGVQDAATTGIKQTTISDSLPSRFWVRFATNGTIAIAAVLAGSARLLGVNAGGQNPFFMMYSTEGWLSGVAPASAPSVATASFPPFAATFRRA